MMKTKKHPWFKPRGYAHFDRPVSVAEAERLVTDPRQVARHAFYPFLRYTVSTQKIEKDPVSGLVRYKKPKNRPISFASHVDSHIYSYYASLLSVPYEQMLVAGGVSDSVLAFRSLGKSNIDFANEAFETVKQMGECIAFATDIVSFFDRLDHTVLKRAWARVLGKTELPPDHYAVFKSLTKYAYAVRDQVFAELGLSSSNPPRAADRICTPKEFRERVRANGLVYQHQEKRGIPQGSPISALLSNLYLLEFDQRLHAEITRRSGFYFRYCDDILCVLPSVQADGLFELVERLIGEYGLDINEDKTETSVFTRLGLHLTADRPLQYLGFTFDGRRKLIRSAAFARFSDKMCKGISLAKLTARKHNKLRFVRRQLKEGIWKSLIYERYSHLGRRNFVRYGLRAAQKMKSTEIRRQLKPLWHRLARRLEKANAELG